MYRCACVCTMFVLFLCGTTFAENVTSMPAELADEFQGDYELVADAKDCPLLPDAEVVAEGKAGYRVAVTIRTQDGKDEALEFRGSPTAGKVALKSGKSSLIGEIENGSMRIKPPGVMAGWLFNRVAKRSATEAAAPPAGAVVLLPYTPGRPTSLDAWTNKKWLVLPDGSVEIGKKCGDNRTVQSFGDCKLHVEFCCPLMPDARGQGRGNSGVYLQDRYEVQVLDSFGLPAKDNECGGIYKVSTPKVNASYPPLAWQTFDITFRAPRLDDAGKVVKNATITVEHNGVLIHENVELKGQTGGGAAGAAKLAPIKLQDHGNPVRYRNIWLVELKDEPKSGKDAATLRAIQGGEFADIGVATQPADVPASQPEGFRPLFNGKDLAGWTCKPGAWVVDGGGVLARGPKGGGYIWTAEQFGDFVLELEFKIAKGSNSGVFFRTAKTGDPVQTGIELQVYDTVGKQPTRNSCGAIYDCVAPSKNVERPVGEWNHVVLTCRGPKIVVVMNGEQIVEMDLDKWTTPRKNPDGSPNKFKTAYKDMPRRGHIGFQDHGNPVWYRNVRIKVTSDQWPVASDQ